MIPLSDELSFWNLAWCGSKLYLLWDPYEAMAKNVIKQKGGLMGIRTAKLSLQSFLSLSSGRIAVISDAISSVVTGNFIVIPSWFSHHVFTIAVPRNAECYAGLGGFYMPATSQSGTLVTVVQYNTY